MKSRLSLSLTSIFIALAATSESNAQTGGISFMPPPGVSEECLVFLPKLERLGWRGAWAEVPLDWKNPASTEKAQVFFYFENKSAQKKRIPILFLNGGPLVSFHGVTETLEAQARKYDRDDNHIFVMVDQRGVGCSTPRVPTDLDQASLRKVGLYRSDSIARDLEKIRIDFFGGQRWKVYAYSFGGTLAARYLTLFPDSASSYHVYAPAIFNNLPEFFSYRIIKQNQVLENFLASSGKPYLGNALSLASAELCLPSDSFAPRVCGRALLDGVLAGLG